MKNFIFTTVFLFSAFVFAEGPTQEKAVEISKQFQVLEASPNVTGIGIGFCDMAGQKLTDFNQPKTICVLIQVQDAKTAKAFKQIFPIGTMIEETFVAVEVVPRLKL